MRRESYESPPPRSQLELGRARPSALVSHRWSVVVQEPVGSFLGTRVSFRSAESRSLPRSPLLACRAAGRARTTNVAPVGRVGSRSRARCRSCLVTRCRTTEFPTALLTMKPTLVSVDIPAVDGFNACTTSVRRPAFTPPRMTVRKSSARRRRACCGSTAQTENRVLGCCHADSLARPFRLRADTIARPARVCIRCRKPCRRARRRLFGW